MKKKIDFDLNKHKLVIDLADWLDSLGVHYHKSGTNQLILKTCFNPNCNAKEKMYVDGKTGFYNCFKCGEREPKVGKGNVIRLGMILGEMSFEETLKKFFNVSLSNDKATMESLLEDDGDLVSKNHEKISIFADPIKLPYYFEPLDKNKHPKAWNYLLGRGIKESTIPKMGAYYGVYGTDEFDDKGNIIAKNKVPRIINVVTLSGKPMGFVARDIASGKPDDPKAPKKVLNSTGKFRSLSVWNMDRVKNSKELIICEGIFSAIQCGIDRSIAVLGKTATEQQLDLIRESKADKVYICLDVGTDPEQDNLYKKLVIYFPGKIYKIKMPEIMDMKRMAISDELKTKIESVFKIKFTQLDGNKINIPFHYKEKIKLELKAFYELKKNNFTDSEFEIVEFLAKKAEYIDAGDYSEEEMNEFISKATLFKKKGLLA